MTPTPSKTHTPDLDGFEAKVSEYLKLVHPDHKDAFRFIFEHSRTFLNPKQAEYLGLITALAITESNKRYAAEEKKTRKLIHPN